MPIFYHFSIQQQPRGTNSFMSMLRGFTHINMSQQRNLWSIKVFSFFSLLCSISLHEIKLYTTIYFLCAFSLDFFAITKNVSISIPIQVSFCSCEKVSLRQIPKNRMAITCILNISKLYFKVVLLNLTLAVYKSLHCFISFPIFYCQTFHGCGFFYFWITGQLSFLYCTSQFLLPLM